jgi:NAD(P)-dependent dehydrogenase (short-subunit alcohol dehydrogenase family)
MLAPMPRGERLRDKVAFVTGGNTGIGAAIVRRLSEEGASVAIAYREEAEGAESLVRELAESGGSCVAVECDVTGAASVAAALEQATAALGPVAVLVNNAAILRRTPFLEIGEAEWDEVVRVALYGAYHCSRAVLPGMIASGSGSIVSIGSELTSIGGELQSHYVAAKSGVVGLTRAIAYELGPRGVRANVVAPGPTETRMLSTELPASFVDSIPLRRLGVPADVAGAVAFLASDDASWVTGQVIGVNGGLAMASC